MPGQRSTQVMILARATLQRAAWTALLGGQPKIEVVDTAGAPDDLVRLPDVSLTILLDLPLPLTSLIAQLQTDHPQAGLLVLVDDYELPVVVSLLREGATGCIGRDETVAELARALIAVGRGEVWLPPAIAVRALAALARGERVSGDTLIEPLTGREVEVVRLLAQGMTNKDIAQSLVLSVRTVEAHLRNIFGKLNVSSRTEAALWATRHGYGAEVGDST